MTEKREDYTAPHPDTAALLWRKDEIAATAHSDSQWVEWPKDITTGFDTRAALNAYSETLRTAPALPLLLETPAAESIGIAALESLIEGSLPTSKYSGNRANYITEALLKDMGRAGWTIVRAAALPPQYQQERPDLAEIKKEIDNMVWANKATGNAGLKTEKLILRLYALAAATPVATAELGGRYSLGVSKQDLLDAANMVEGKGMKREASMMRSLIDQVEDLQEVEATPVATVGSKPAQKYSVLPSSPTDDEPTTNRC